MGYSVEMKEAVIQKVLLGNKTQLEISKEAGIGLSTLRNWLKQYRGSGAVQVKNNEKRPQDWTAEERLAALIETGLLTAEERVAWCRKHGLFAHHLAQWKADAIAATTQTRGKSKEDLSLKKENAALKKELFRKDKALAETAALLVLKKKAHAIWGDPEDE